jgi:hypothetical protein
MKSNHGFTVLRNQHKDTILKTLKRHKGSGYYRTGSFSDELIWEGRRFVFPTSDSRIGAGMWVFRSVVADVKKYLLANPKPVEIPRLPVNMWNEELRKFRGKIAATDVDHAYWRIAYLDGVISAKTYKRGLELPDKSLRLAALANLASAKEYRIISDGEITDETKVLRFDPMHQLVYNNIRNACFGHMKNMADMLEGDFICYKTDCIYYRDRNGNSEKVQMYLDSVGLYWKQLVEVDKKNGDAGHKPRPPR